MFEYTIPGGLPAGSRGVWSNLPLRPLAEGILTPLSYSTLADVVGRAWYKYFDALDFDPMPRARVMRQVNGLPYLSLTLSAQRDAEQAAIEPMSLLVNGQPFAITKWEKPGFLAGIKFGMKERKVMALIEKQEQEIDKITAKLSTWYDKVKEYRWTQADILLVMEEIEPVGSEPMMAWLAARHNLDLLINRLLHASQKSAPFPANLALIEGALGPLYKASCGTEAHRALNEAELRNPRWEEDASAERPSASTPPTGNDQALLTAIDSSQRKAAQEWLKQAHRLLALQGKAQNAFAYILAATRRWANAAEREAMADKRIAEVGDVFFYELEEVKQMMTGEWNVSNAKGIQSTAQKRKAEYAQWQAASPAEVLIGDTAAQKRGS